MQSIKAHNVGLRLFFFWLGIISTLSYRAIILNYQNHLWVAMTWYAGTICSIIYFGHRYDIEKKRAKLVEKYDLVKLVESRDYGEWDQKEALHYVVKTALISKAQYNSLFIFVLSITVLFIGLIMDLMRIL